VSQTGWQYLEFAYFVIFPMALAYLFWFKAMRDGKKEMVTAFSYLVPFVSTLISGLYLKVKIGPSFCAAAL
jgi:drug/metabolite transporter (DMT)-like permease